LALLPAASKFYSDSGIGAILLFCFETLAYGIYTFLEVVTNAE
jgi:hypothetical protein